MIPRLAHPTVCVIDDEPEEYLPILKALARLGLAYRHIRGTSSTAIRRPLQGIRLVFTDLHLGGHVGKDAASHTANVFKAAIPPDTAPLVVIIWSKYVDDPAGDANLPPQDQPTEADLFKNALLEAVPAFKDRLIFCEMKKPKPKNRPSEDKWAMQLKTDITKQLENVPAFDVLWTWESLVRDAGTRLTQSLTTLALATTADASTTEPASSLHDKLKTALRVLVKEQGGPACSTLEAPHHLASVLGQTLADHIEHLDSLRPLAKHGAWLSDQNGLPDSVPIAAGVNGFLLTAGLSAKPQAFVPGTIYRFSDVEKFKELFGVSAGELINAGYKKVEDAPASWDRATWKAKAKPILLEVSPSCDVHQGHRRKALLIAGLILPAAARANAKRDGAFDIFPSFSLRWATDDLDKQEVFLLFCSRYKTTLTCNKEPRWLKPWFRLRELPTAALRNWHSNHASRVGYVSLRAS